MRCCQALAAIRGRDYVIPDDVKTLAVPVLAHRVMLRSVGSTADREAFLESVLGCVRTPTENERR
jgi:MoxR-like ATPase